MHPDQPTAAPTVGEGGAGLVITQEPGPRDTGDDQVPAAADLHGPALHQAAQQSGQVVTGQNTRPPMPSTPRSRARQRAGHQLRLALLLWCQL
jgi:hypothetical protein